MTDQDSAQNALPRPVERAWTQLLEALRQAGVPSAEEGAYGFGGLPPEVRRVLTFIDRRWPGAYAASDSATKIEETDMPPAPADPPIVATEQPAVDAAEVTPDAAEGMSMAVSKQTILLKNARIDQPYQETIALEGVDELELIDDADTGLALDPEQDAAILKGLPRHSGDFLLRLRGWRADRPCEISAHLAVIPDPKSLWVSKESDREDPFWKPDAVFQRVEGELLCIGASKRGRAHAKDGLFRDDHVGVSVDAASGWHIAAVADGAGSARFSRRGSQIAVDSVIEHLPARLQTHVSPHLDALVAAYLSQAPDAEARLKGQLYRALAAAAFDAAKAIEAEAAAHDQTAAAFSTTLVVGVARKLEDGWFFAAFSVGDGGAAVFDLDAESLTTLSLPDSGEFAGQTRFLHKSEFVDYEAVAKRIFFAVRPSFTAMILMTDGITDAKFPTETLFAQHAQWFAFWRDDLAQAVEFSRANADLQAQLLAWLDFWSAGNHDDRTLAVLVP